MRLGLQLLLVFAVVILQVSFFGHLRPLGIIPDLALILIVFIGLWEEATPTLALAIVTGLLLDLMSGADFGLHTALLVVVALTIIASRQFGLQAESVVGAAAMVAAGTLVTNIAVIASIGGGVKIDWAVVLTRIGAQLVLNSVLVVLVFAVRAVVGDRRTRVSTELKRGSWI